MKIILNFCNHICTLKCLTLSVLKKGDNNFISFKSKTETIIIDRDIISSKTLYPYFSAH